MFLRRILLKTDRQLDDEYNIDMDEVSRRGIYKDTYKSHNLWNDYQFRPNFAIAMVVAPELFDPQHALECLLLADQVLRGPTGMRTLDPLDINYRPYYINSDDSDDFHVAKGRNYHQGPEWLWCTGVFLRAFLKFDLPRRKDKAGRVETLQQLHARLYNHRTMIQEDPWAGLVELTNKDGGDSTYDRANVSRLL
jgi:glycogen debranching enzyme